MLTSPDTTAPAASCPKCQTKVVTEGDEPAWCERCQWNLDAFVPEPGGWLARRLARFDHFAGYSLSARLFRALEGKPIERPGVGLATLWLAVISGALLAAIIGLAAFGLWLVITQTFVLKAIGGLLLLLAFVLRPRFGRLKPLLKEYDEITRAEAPRLFALIDSVAAAANAPTPHRVLLGAEWNAFAGTFGIRRRRMLMLGLPFWAALRPQERVALLGHEVGHYANGDLRTTTMTMPAMRTFGILAEMLYPDPGSTQGSALGFVGYLAELIVRPIFLVSAHFCWLIHLGTNMIGARQAQRAEYYADELAVRVAGSQAALGLQDVLAISDGLIAVVGGRSRRNQRAAGWREGVERAREGMTDRMPRLRQLSLRRRASLFASHPPPGLRHALIAARPHRDGQVVLTESEVEMIDAELAKHEERYRRVIAESW